MSEIKISMEGTNLSRRISNDLCSYYPLKEKEPNSPLLKCELCIMLAFKDYGMKGVQKYLSSGET